MHLKIFYIESYHVGPAALTLVTPKCKVKRIKITYSST